MEYFKGIIMRMIIKIKKWLKKNLIIKEKKIAINSFMIENPNYGKYSIGTGSYGFPKILDWNDNAELVIGKYCSFAADVSILLGGEHHSDWITTYPFSSLNENMSDMECNRKSKGDVIIGNDVWIGFNVIILSGVKIGNGAIVGAGSTVIKDVPNYSIFAGNPAKLIRFRFDNETIEKLNKIAWWDWSIQKIEQNKHLFLSNMTEDFLKIHSK
jgi:virginiamycin A acetyltransferase